MGSQRFLASFPAPGRACGVWHGCCWGSKKRSMCDHATIRGYEVPAGLRRMGKLQCLVSQVSEAACLFCLFTSVNRGPGRGPGLSSPCHCCPFSAGLAWTAWSLFRGRSTAASGITVQDLDRYQPVLIRYQVLVIRAEGISRVGSPRPSRLRPNASVAGKEIRPLACSPMLVGSRFIPRNILFGPGFPFSKHCRDDMSESVSGRTAPSV
jgi:hypothetical protein